jgi:hypothetical protein
MFVKDVLVNEFRSLESLIAYFTHVNLVFGDLGGLFLSIFLFHILKHTVLLRRKSFPHSSFNSLLASFNVFILEILASRPVRT